jgi:hypothetical protein
VTPALFLLFGVLAGCGGNDSPTAPPPGPPIDTSGQIVYSRTRDGAGNIAPVLAESGGSGFDGFEVDSPGVAVDGGRPGGDKFLVYYEAEGPTGSTIGLVSSVEENLVPLTIGRTQVVGLGPGGGPYAFGATDPTVLVDKRPGEESRRYKMWFEGRGGSGGAVSTIMYGTSTDGVSWSAFTPCTGLAPSFGSVRVADPTVVLVSGQYRMWFEAVDVTTGTSDGPASIGYAESADGITWSVKDAAGATGSSAAPVFNPAGGTGFDAFTVGSPSVVHDPGDAAAPWKLWYEAGDRAGDVQNTIGYATSADGLTWIRATLPVLNPSSDARVPLPFDSGDLEHPCAFVNDSLPPTDPDHFLMWYTGDAEGSQTPNRIGLVTGRSP